MNLALEFVPPGHAAVLSYTSPLWVAVIDAASGRALGRREWAGVGLGVVGIVLIVNPLTLAATGEGLLGSAMMLASAIVWAATIMYLRRHRWHATPLELTPWELLLALVPLALLAIVLDGGRPIDPTWQAAVTLLYSGLLATAFAYWAMQTIARSVPPLVATLGLLLVPVVGLVASTVALGEPLGPIDLAGIATCLAGIALVTTARRAGSAVRHVGERPGSVVRGGGETIR